MTHEVIRRLRASGWMVGSHNDYTVEGGPNRTYWMFTHPSGRWVEGDGADDAEALDQCREAATKLGLMK